MEAAWAPRLRKLLRTCCGSVAITGRSARCQRRQQERPREEVAPRTRPVCGRLALRTGGLGAARAGRARSACRWVFRFVLFCGFCFVFFFFNRLSL